jgi:long-chain acyl-CoA synthetase
MLLGDGRPYCTAIFWVNSDAAKANLVNRIRQAIFEINKQLSHPEQIRRWAILEHNLSIERGEITSSLKLKRNEVTRRLTHIIEALYSQELPKLGDVLHICDVDEDPQPELSPEEPT